MVHSSDGFRPGCCLHRVLAKSLSRILPLNSGCRLCEVGIVITVIASTIFCGSTLHEEALDKCQLPFRGDKM